MIKYFIDRPISVFVTFGIFVMLGIIAFLKIPTSLLPDIPVPRISVQISASDLPARELESSVVTPLRQQLMQIAHLRDIKSETHNESARIYLQFDYGTRMDLAFVEANEKVDAAMNSLPKGVKRPTVVKVNATDLPVFDLILTLKDRNRQKSEEVAFGEMCDLSRNVIKRRLEQLPEVAMADVSGMWEKQLVILPDNEKMKSLGLTNKELESAFEANNIETGSATVRDGCYEYSIRFTSVLRTADDVQNIYMKHADRLFQLKDIAQVKFKPIDRTGEVLYNGKRAVVLSVIKQSSVKMSDLQQQMDQTLAHFETQYPEIDFTITHDQSQLLGMTMESLKQNLALGLLLILVVTAYFLRDIKMPFVIGLSLLVSLIASMGALYLFHISLNIVSIAGLILSVGMMIDNAIIVTDDITQFRHKGLSLDAACIKGTEDVITPMLSSILTTIAVFLPLIFMNGIAGAIFYDQAVSITLSLLVSYITAIIFLPVLYKLVFSLRRKKQKPIEDKEHQWLMRFYDYGIKQTFKYKKTACIVVACSIPLCLFLFKVIGKEKMPQIGHSETVVFIDWNENIHVDENTKRTQAFIKQLGKQAKETMVLVGQQQFIIGNNKNLNASQAKVYIQTENKDSIGVLEQKVCSFFAQNYPKVVATLSPPETVFEEIFTTSEPDLVLELYPHNGLWTFTPDSLDRFRRIVETGTRLHVQAPIYSNRIKVYIDHKKLLLYDITPDEVISKLKNSLGENHFATLRNFAEYIPVQIEKEKKTLECILAETFISGSKAETYPLASFVALSEDRGIKEIVSGNSGEYVPFYFPKIESEQQAVTDLRAVMAQHPEWDYAQSGAVYQNKKMIENLILILLVSVVMMYLIMTAQFESFTQPLILLAEIPIDIAVALGCLMFFGHTLNLMSAIGIIVTCGIIVNDSILKINVINELRAAGMPVMEAIHEAGKRRLRAIVMTSLTSILAMIPTLFSEDMGSELQKPLAIAMISALVIGTLVSLFVIPLLYWFIYRNKPVKETVTT